MNGIRGVLQIIIPSLVAVILLRTDSSLSRNISVLFILITLVIFGVLVNSYIGQSVTNVIQKSHLEFGEGLIFDNLIKAIDQYSLLFDLKLQSGRELISLEGFYFANRLFAFIIFFLLPIYIFKTIKKDNTLLFWSYKYFIILLIVLSANILGTSDFPRYFIPVLIAAFFMIAVAFDRMHKFIKFLILTVVSIQSAYSLMFFYQQSSNSESPDAKLISEYLIENSMTHGVLYNWAEGLLPINNFSNGKITLGLVDKDTFWLHWHGSNFFRTKLSSAENIFVLASNNDVRENPLLLKLIDKFKFKITDLGNYSVLTTYDKSFLKFLNTDFGGFNFKKGDFTLNSTETITDFLITPFEHGTNIQCTSPNLSFSSVNGSDYERTQFKERKVIGSYVSSDKDTGVIELSSKTELKKICFLMKSGPDSSNQTISIIDKEGDIALQNQQIPILSVWHVATITCANSCYGVVFIV